MPARGRNARGGRVGVSVVAGSRVITVRVGDTEIQVEAVVVAGTEPTSGAAGRAAGNVLGAFDRAQETIIEVAKSTAQMIDRAGAAARPDRVDVEFGLKFSASGGVIMAGVAGEASLKVTFGYDVTPARGRPLRPAAEPLPRAGGRGVVTGRGSRTGGARIPGPGPGRRGRPGRDVFPGRAGRAGDGVARAEGHRRRGPGRPGRRSIRWPAGTRSAPPSRAWIQCMTWRY